MQCCRRAKHADRPQEQCTLKRSSPRCKSCPEPCCTDTLCWAGNYPWFNLHNAAGARRRALQGTPNAGKRKISKRDITDPSSIAVSRVLGAGRKTGEAQGRYARLCRTFNRRPFASVWTRERVAFGAPSLVQASEPRGDLGASSRAAEGGEKTLLSAEARSTILIRSWTSTRTTTGYGEVGAGRPEAKAVRGSDQTQRHNSHHGGFRFGRVDARNSTRTPRRVFLVRVC